MKGSAGRATRPWRRRRAWARGVARCALGLWAQACVLDLEGSAPEPPGAGEIRSPSESVPASLPSDAGASGARVSRVPSVPAVLDVGADADPDAGWAVSEERDVDAGLVVEECPARELRVVRDECVCTVDVAPCPTAGPGLLGTYFASERLAGEVLTRVDERVAFDWGDGAPLAGVGDDRFSVRWSGGVRASYSERYTFSVYADDGVRLWVGGQLIVDSWARGSKLHTGSAVLTAGEVTTLGIDYFESKGDARVELRWASDRQPAQVIGPEHLTWWRDGARTASGLTASSNRASPFDADAGRAVDGTASTEWVALAGQAWLQLAFEREPPRTVSRYRLISARAGPDHDPRDWRLLGSDDGVTWRELDERRGERFEERLQSRRFKLDGEVTYRFYRLDISSNRAEDDAGEVRVAELVLEG